MSRINKLTSARWAASSLLAGLWFAGQVQAQVLPTIDCKPDSVAQLNTGQTSAGDPATDLNWKFQYLPTYSGSDPVNWGAFGAAKLVTSPTASWSSTPANSSTAKWIGMDAFGSQPYTDGSNFGNIDGLFQVQFNLASTVSLGGFQPSMTYSADNSVVDIFINGKSQLARGAGTWGLPQAGGTNQFNYNGFGTGRWLTIASMASPDWQPGANTLTVYVKSSRPFMGFAAAISGTNACAPNVAPTAVPAISGTTQVGSTMTGTYTYADTESDVEDPAGTAFKFVTSPNASIASSGDGTTVASGTTGGAAASTSYTLQAADADMYLYYCVTPAAKTGTSPGTETCSAASSKIVAPPKPPAQPANVPTLGEWALMGLAALLALLGIGAIRRQSV
ncbi:IPTL-CTERM sorting domain-containing protein [Comamonas odontotermitis]|uniref:IPTL-CTERM sorting domain-containing protein n=1 Tax=Comamonas odontotermitis TaxID=379895 RepID=UPI0037523FFB